MIHLLTIRNCINIIIILLIVLTLVLWLFYAISNNIKYLCYARNVSFINMLLGWLYLMIPNKDIALEFLIR